MAAMEVSQSSSGQHLSDSISSNKEGCKKLNNISSPRPYMKILEQPAYDKFRFRYLSESSNKKSGVKVTIGSIPGVNSSCEKKTWPTIQIVGCRDPVVVVVSCVTKDFDPSDPSKVGCYRPHPHKLVGQDGCDDGICSIQIENKTMTHTFDHLGIQCVRRDEIIGSLELRKSRRVDPFLTGYSHQSIDLSCVRLCFQAFVKKSSKDFIPLEPVVSDPIHDSKSVPKLDIQVLSHASAPVTGNQSMILLCDKVSKDDIEIWFYEEGEGGWKAKGNFVAEQVHHKVAITFKTPKYHNLQVDHPVNVFIQLTRPSDGMKSEGRKFQLTPCNTGNKRMKISSSPKATMCDNLKQNAGNISLPSFSSIHMPSLPDCNLPIPSFLSPVQEITLRNPDNKWLLCSVSTKERSAKHCNSPSPLPFGIHSEITWQDPVENLPSSKQAQLQTHLELFKNLSSTSLHHAQSTAEYNRFGWNSPVPSATGQFSLPNYADNLPLSPPSPNWQSSVDYNHMTASSVDCNHMSAQQRPTTELLNRETLSLMNPLPHVRLPPEYPHPVPDKLPVGPKVNLRSPTNVPSSFSSDFKIFGSLTPAEVGQEQHCALPKIHCPESHHPPANTDGSGQTARREAADELTIDGLVEQFVRDSRELVDYQKSMDYLVESTSNSFSNLNVSQELSSH